MQAKSFEGPAFFQGMCHFKFSFKCLARACVCVRVCDKSVLQHPKQVKSDFASNWARDIKGVRAIREHQRCSVLSLSLTSSHFRLVEVEPLDEIMSPFVPSF